MRGRSLAKAAGSGRMRFFQVHLFVFELMLETQTTETNARRVRNPLQQHQQLWTILSRGPLQPWWGQGSDVKDQSSGQTSRLRIYTLKVVCTVWSLC